MKNFHLMTSLLILAAAASVSGNSEVRESSSTYSCCGSPAVPFDQHCDNTWSSHGTNFAYSNYLSDTDQKCILPCKEVKGGEMMLETCVDVNVTSVCMEINVMVERRTSYRSQACPESLSNTAGDQAVRAGVLMFSLVITGRFVK